MSNLDTLKCCPVLFKGIEKNTSIWDSTDIEGTMQWHLHKVIQEQLLDLQHDVMKARMSKMVRHMLHRQSGLSSFHFLILPKMDTG
eukprot:3707867-Amphidinium_carterae.1